jgi:hypothetical protein
MLRAGFMQPPPSSHMDLVDQYGASSTGAHPASSETHGLEVVLDDL